MQTKITFIVVMVLASTFHLKAQSFEGKITYQNKYKSKLPNISDEQFSAMMGTTQEYFIKGADFKSSMNGSFFQWQIYVSKDNKLYNKLANSETLLWVDVGTNTDEVIKSELNKGAATILGYSCDELILTCKSGVQKYYFNAIVSVDATKYAGFKYLNWSEFISRSKALPLKMIVESQQFSMESIATEIKAQKLEDTLFALPANAPVQKSPY